MSDALSKAFADADSCYIACSKAVAGRGSSALVTAPAGIAATPSSLAKAAEQYKANVGWVYTAVKAIAQKIAEREVFVGSLGRKPKRQKSIGDNVEPMESHPILDLLADPAPLFTRWSLLYMTVANLELTGRAHWWITEEDGRPELWPLPSSWCTPAAGVDDCY